MIRRRMPALLLVLALLGAWQLYASLSGIDSLLLPPPGQVAAALVDDAGLLWSNFGVTAREVLLGVAAALLVGVALAAALHCWEPLRRACYPLLVASQTVPIPIVAPLLVVWFGYTLLPKVAIVALVCFFPIVVATLDALEGIDPRLGKLMHTLGATRWQTFRRVEAPSALPGVFSGARIAVTIAVLGAVFAEWAGSSAGLGRLILQSTAQLQTARACAAVVVLAAFAIMLFVLVNQLERRLVPWAARR